MIRLMLGDCRDSLRSLPSASVQCVVTSPPYFGLRDYGLPPLVWGGDPEHVHDWALELRPAKDGGQNSPKLQTKGTTNFQSMPSSEHGCCSCGAWLGSHGLEPTPELYLQHEVEIFSEVRRVLRDDGTLWLNLGDSYAGSGKGPSESLQPLASQLQRVGPQPHTIGTGRQFGYKPKDLMLLPFRVAMALQADGWYVRSTIPWLKRNSMPESVTDRPSSAVEYVFLLSKSPRYFWDPDAVRTSAEYGRREHSTGWKPWGKQQDGVRSNGSVTGSDPSAGRNRRNSDWFFESWQGLLLDECDQPQALLVNPQPFSGAHFATFPPKLVEPMLKSSTSERGQCPDCGAAWVRESSAHIEFTQRVHNHQKYPDGQLGHAAANRHRDGHVPGRKVSETTGWRPTCAHADLEPVPQTVLDCFAGAGTVGLVADRLNRDAVLLDLKPDYHLMTNSRITQDAPLFVQLEAGLFDGALHDSR